MTKPAAKKTETKPAKKTEAKEPKSKKTETKKNEERSIEDASDYYMGLIDQDHYGQAEATQQESVDFYRNIASTCNERADLIESEMEEGDGDDKDEEGDEEDEDE